MEENKNVLELIDEASSLVENKEFAKCLSLLQKHKNIVDKNVELLKVAGLCFVNLENDDEALQVFERVVELDKNDATSWFYLASLYDKKNMLFEAQTAYETVIELREEYLDAHKNLAIILIKLTEFETAKEHAQRALELSDEDDYQIYYILATYAMNKRDFENVIYYLEVALKLNPTHLQILNNLGAAYLATNKKKKALECYEKAYELDENYAMTNYNLGCYKQLERKFEESFSFFQKAYSLDPTSSNLQALGIAAEYAKKWQEVAQIYTTLLTLDPTNISYHEALAVALCELGDFKKAIDSLKVIHNANPNNMAIIERLVDAYLVTNQLDRLKNFLARIIKRGKIATQLYYTYAITCARTGDFDTAVSIYKKIIQLEPDNWAAHKDLGVIYLMQKLFDWAEDEFKTAYNINKSHAMTFEMATFYYQIHKYKEAEPYYEEALTLAPKDINTILFAGLNYLQLNNIPLAKKYLEKVYKKTPDDMLVAFSLARIYYVEKKYKAAQQILFGLSTFNNDLEIINLLAMIHFELKEFEEAKDVFKLVLAQSEGNTNVLLNLAKCEIGLDNKDAALEYLNQYLEIFPDSEEVHDLIWQIS